MKKSVDLIQVRGRSLLEGALGLVYEVKPLLKIPLSEREVNYFLNFCVPISPKEWESNPEPRCLDVETYDKEIRKLLRSRKISAVIGKDWSGYTQFHPKLMEMWIL